MGGHIARSRYPAAERAATSTSVDYVWLRADIADPLERHATHLAEANGTRAKDAKINGGRETAGTHLISG